jgi:hypothetical protein
MSGSGADDLPLFHGPHIPRIRFELALDRLDLHAAVAMAPQRWQAAVEALAAVVDRAGTPARIDVEALARCRCDGWPAVLEQTWQRLMGRSLDGRGVPGTYGGELAAAFLLRADERTRARDSLHRHLQYHPRDSRGWQLLTSFEPVRGAARCGFHGGPLLDAAGDLIDLVREDGLLPAERWLLPYAWFTHRIDLDEMRDALEAEHLLARPPLVLPGDARAFAWYLLDAGGRRYVGQSVGVIEARKRLQQISAAAFRRYLARV